MIATLILTVIALVSVIFLRFKWIQRVYDRAWECWDVEQWYLSHIIVNLSDREIEQIEEDVEEIICSYQLDWKGIFDLTLWRFQSIFPNLEDKLDVYCDKIRATYEK